jgi:hypothetical protein
VQPIARPEAFDVDANTFAVNTLLTTTPFVYTTSAVTNVDAIELIIAAPTGHHPYAQGHGQRQLDALQGSVPRARHGSMDELRRPRLRRGDRDPEDHAQAADDVSRDGPDREAALRQHPDAGAL